MIDKATVDRIYMTANIVEVIGDFISLKKKGTNYQACCPFHGEKTPSFMVSPSKGIYKCFGCGKGGNAVSFIMDHENVSYVDALKYIAKKYGITIEEKEETEQDIAQRNDREAMMQATDYANQFFKDKLLNSQEGRAVGLSYFRERGFTDTTIELFQLGYCPSKGDLFSLSAIEKGHKENHLVATGLTIKNDRGYYDRFTGRVMFPIQSISGRIIGFGGRILTSDKKKAKYLNSPESEIYHKSNTLYGIFQAKRAISQLNKCILVEGYTDVISMFQSGIENVVASSGTSLTVEQIALIARFTHNVTIIYDGDSAGIKASMRGINLILKEGLNVRIVPLPEEHDPDSFAKSHTSTETYNYITENEEDFISFKTKLLMKDVKNDPIAKSAVIHDIVETIAFIKDEVLRSQYVKESSRLLDVDDDLLSKEVMRLVISNRGGKQEMEVYRNLQKKENFNKSLVKASKREGVAIYEMEKELITYLIKDGAENFIFVEPRQEPIELNIAEVIIEEMECDELSFVTPLFDTIFTEYVKLFKSGVSVSAHDLINNPNSAISDFIVDIITLEEQYKESKIWSKHIKNFGGSVKLSEAIPKCIALYKLKRLEMLIANRKEALKVEGADFANLLYEIKTLNDSRITVCNKYERIL